MQGTILWVLEKKIQKEIITHVKPCGYLQTLILQLSVIIHCELKATTGYQANSTSDKPVKMGLLKW